MDLKSRTAHKRLSPKRPAPQWAERIPLHLPNLPGSLEGVTVLHISDVHARRYRPRFRRLIEMCQREEPDLVFLTGDYMSYPGDETASLRVLSDIVDACNPPLGIFGTFGNHDFPKFRRMAQQIHRVHWIEEGAMVLPELGVTMVGTSTPCDLVTALLTAGRMEADAGYPIDANGKPSSYRILLGHEPSILVTAAELGLEWSLAGHTHGGQMRLGVKIAFHTSCDLPGSHASGILRFRDSVCTISRGLGESYFDIRFFCPPHLPMYVLSRGDLPGEYCTQLECVHWW